MAFKYKKRPRPPQVWTKNRIAPPTNNTEGLTGIVQGQTASDLEERFARALNAQGLDYDFSFPVFSSYSLPGQQNEIDFMVYQGGLTYPIEIDGEFSHKSAEQKQDDLARDAILWGDMKDKFQGLQPIERIPSYELETQDLANAKVQEIF